MCNRVLALSAVIAVLFVLYYRIFVRPLSDLLSAIPEILGASLLLWAAVAIVLGMLAEAILLLTGRGQRPSVDEAATPPVNVGLPPGRAE